MFKTCALIVGIFIKSVWVNQLLSPAFVLSIFYNRINGAFEQLFAILLHSLLPPVFDGILSVKLVFSTLYTELLINKPIQFKKGLVI